jgi:hypothetical protein
LGAIELCLQLERARLNSGLFTGANLKGADLAGANARCRPEHHWEFAKWAPWCGNALLTLASGVCLIYLARTCGVMLAGLAAAIVIGASAWLGGGALLDNGAWMPVAQLLAWWLLQRRPDKQVLAVVLASPHLSGYLPRLAQRQTSALPDVGRPIFSLNV